MLNTRKLKEQIDDYRQKPKDYTLKYHHSKYFIISEYLQVLKYNQL